MEYMLKFLMFFFLITFGINFVYAEPVVNDVNYIVEEFANGFTFPTAIEFVENGMLVIERLNGKVYHIDNIENDPKLVLELNVDGGAETGLLGITSVNSDVYLYFTETTPDTDETLGNRIYKYFWDGHSLTNPILVNDFPFHKSNSHVGGSLTHDNDGNVFIITGDMSAADYNYEGPLQNNPSGEYNDNGAVILVGFDPSITRPSNLENPLSHYYAIGIRNSFGLTVDPKTNFLWDTENGPNFYDEINFVEKNSNSGWSVIMGPASQDELKRIPQIENYFYSDPEFTWKATVAPTALTFTQSEFFNSYNDYLFVADCMGGNINKFKLNSERTGFSFQDPRLHDKILNLDDSVREIIFATGFNCLTDLKFGPDGFLYTVSHFDGKIHRILPKEFSNSTQINERDFTNANLQFANFTNANLQFANFTNANLQFANFTNANLQFSTFTNASLSNVIYEKSNLISSNFIGTSINNSNFVSSNLRYSQLSDSIIKNTDFSNTVLTGGNFMNAEISQSNFTNSFLKSSTFKNSIISNSDFNNSTIRTGNLVNATIFISNFKDVELSYSELQNTSFKKSNLINLNYFNANIEGIQLNDSEFNGCFGQDIYHRGLTKIYRIFEEQNILIFPIDEILKFVCF
jgi:aldose sugar dehydrogenase